MKKIFMVFALFIFIGCGGSESEDFSESKDCTTIDNNMWSSPSSSHMSWSDAGNYCNNLTECGYSDWRLPNIDELKTLLTSATGGTPRSANCQVSETNNCLSESCWTCSTCTENCSDTENGCGNCSYYNDGRFSKLGEATVLWSSSTHVSSTSFAWIVNFNHGLVGYYDKTHGYDVRCVR